MYYIPHVFLLMYLLALLGSQKEQIGFNSKNIFLTFLSLLCQSLIDSPPLLVGGYGGCMSQQLHPHIYTPSYIHTIIYTHHHIYTPSYIHTIIYTHHHIYTLSYIHTIIYTHHQSANKYLSLLSTALYFTWVVLILSLSQTSSSFHR